MWPFKPKQTDLSRLMDAMLSHMEVDLKFANTVLAEVCRLDKRLDQLEQKLEEIKGNDVWSILYGRDSSRGIVDFKKEMLQRSMPIQDPALALNSSDITQPGQVE